MLSVRIIIWIIKLEQVFVKSPKLMKWKKWEKMRLLDKSIEVNI